MPFVNEKILCIIIIIIRFLALLVLMHDIWAIERSIMCAYNLQDFYINFD